LPPVLPAATIVVPGTNLTTEGNDNNSYPFNISDFDQTSQRYQQAYSSVAFGVTPILISGIDFRPDAFLGKPFSVILSSIRIDLSTTSRAVNNLSLTFANNVGTDNTIVFGTGPLSLSSANVGPVNGPKAFDIHIEFSSPFLYDPNKGNLLLDVHNIGGGTAIPFDSTTLSGAVTSRVYTINGIGSLTADAADSIALVTQFDFTIGVPELSTRLFTGVALAAVFLIRGKGWRAAGSV
jgi:hypothetical protein